jgi:hypothetical protein
VSYACRATDKARKLRHITLMWETKVAISAILCLLAFVTGGTWLLGEHVLFHLEIGASAFREHRDVLGLVFLASVCSLLVSSVAERERNGDRASQPDENLDCARDGAPSPHRENDAEKRR